MKFRVSLSNKPQLFVDSLISYSTVFAVRSKYCTNLYLYLYISYLFSILSSIKLYLISVKVQRYKLRPCNVLENNAILTVNYITCFIIDFIFFLYYTLVFVISEIFSFLSAFKYVAKDKFQIANTRGLLKTTRNKQ